MAHDETPVQATDLATLRSRVKAGLAAKKISGRQLEIKLNLATGVLSKVYSGRIRLTQNLLAQVATGLGVTERSLVEGIVFASIAESMVGSPVLDMAQQLATQRDDLERKLAGVQAELVAMSNVVDRAERKAAAAQDETIRLRAEVERLKPFHTEAHELRQHVRVLSGDFVRTSKQLEVATEQLRSTQRHATGLAESLQQWKDYANSLVAKLADGNKKVAAAALGAGALSFLLGIGIGAATSGSDGD